MDSLQKREERDGNSDLHGISIRVGPCIRELFKKIKGGKRM